MVLPGRERSLMIASAMWIQSINVPDRQTDRHRLKPRPRLRIASRGKNLHLPVQAKLYNIVHIKMNIVYQVGPKPIMQAYVVTS